MAVSFQEKMNILGLPNELLAHIASFLTKDSDLAQLVKTHPAFYQVLNRALYEQNQRNVDNYRTESEIPAPESALYWAVVNSQLATIKRAMGFGLDLNQHTPPGYSLLHFACSLGQSEVVRFLLDTGDVDSSLRERGTRSPLHIAAFTGHTHIINLLLDYNLRRRLAAPEDTPLVDVNSGDYRIETPLMVAARWGNADVVAALLTAEGIDPQRRDFVGDIPLLVASNKDHIRVVEVMLASDKVDANAATSAGQTTLVSEMVFGQNEEILRVLLASNRIDIHKPALAWPGDNTPRTPFEVACMSPNLTGAEMLIDAGLDPNSRGAEGRTPLHVAVDYRQTKLVAKLLSIEGTDVNARDDNGNTPLHPVETNWRGPQTEEEQDEREQSQREITSMLLNIPGIDHEPINNSNETPLYSAIRCFDQRHTIELLADVTDVDLNGPICPASNLSALMLATQSWEEDAFTTLLGHPKVNQNLSLKDMPRFLLHNICSRRVYFPEVLRVLLEEGADLNERDERGMTPLLASLNSGELATTYFILGRAELDASPSAFETPGPRSFIHEIMSFAGEIRSELWSYLFTHESFDPNMVDYDNRTALLYIIEDGDDQELKMYLASRRVDVNQADIQGLTPMHHALRAFESARTEPSLNPEMYENMIRMLAKHDKIDLSVLDHSQTCVVQSIVESTPDGLTHRKGGVVWSGRI